MYVLLLCRKYLTTRYIALASVISVMLGVATMIVVNGVMEGFFVEMQDRVHGALSDVMLESPIPGFEDAERHMNAIHKIAGEHIEGMTPVVMVPAMISYKVQNQWVNNQVQLIGIDEKSLSGAGDFLKFLQHPENQRQFSFNLREGGFDTRGGEREMLRTAGWPHRREMAERQKYATDEDDDPLRIKAAAPKSNGAAPTPQDPFLQQAAQAEAAGHKPPFQPEQNVLDPKTQQHTGLVLGIALSSYQDRLGNENFLVRPGDDVRLSFPTAATPPRPIDDVFTIVDFYECKMSEYDSKFVFVPLKKLQQLCGLIDPQTGMARVTSIQIKLKNEADGDLVRDKLRAVFDPQLYRVSTWRDQQGPLLAAVQMETAILNVLLFLIVAVAGFGILAIFYMIVVEKTKDIGILKSLGASARGIMGIFLGYGLLLGAVGAGGGFGLGMLLIHYINEVADFLSMLTGHKVFDPKVYYFYQIPTIVEPFTVCWIVLGALFISVAASVMPALRAARMHPVEALRYD